MFKRIMVPVDLAHAPTLERALGAAADLARLYEARITCVGVFDNVPTTLARTTAESKARLKAFAERQGLEHGVGFAHHAVFVPDPGADLVAVLLAEVRRLEIDLVVMATHLPGWAEHIFSARGGAIAAHAPVSVFLVR